MGLTTFVAHLPTGILLCISINGFEEPLWDKNHLILLSFIVTMQFLLIFLKNLSLTIDGFCWTHQTNSIWPLIDRLMQQMHRHSIYIATNTCTLHNAKVLYCTCFKGTAKLSKNCPFASVWSKMGTFEDSELPFKNTPKPLPIIGL